MQAGEKPFDDALGNHFEAAQAGDLGRVEQIEPGFERGSDDGGHMPRPT